MRAAPIAVPAGGATIAGGLAGAVAAAVGLLASGQSPAPSALALGGLAGAVPAGAVAVILARRGAGLARRVLDALGDDAPPRGAFSPAAAAAACLERLEAERAEARERRRGGEVEQQVVRAALGRLREGVLRLPEGMAVLDAADAVVLANPAARRRLGLASEDGRGPLPSGEESEVLLRAIAEARADGAEAERRLELPPGGEDGVEREVTVRSLRDDEGRDVGSVLLVRDLSRERALGRMTSEFVAKASHELRTPLSSIAAYAEMLVDGEAADEAARHECYEVIEAEARRLGRLIDDMLDISRIEAGLTRVDRGPVDLGAVLGRAAETIQPQAQEKQQLLQVRVAEVDLHVEGDEDMLLRVMLNLLSNAVKYTPEGGRITASVDSDHLTGSVVLSVEDTGMGIPPDRLDKVFDKFYRIESYERMARGTGLGLNLSRHIVETLHGGQIGVESTLGMGSKFWISVPVRHAGGRRAA